MLDIPLNFKALDNVLIKISLESRVRYERRLDSDFNSAVVDNRSDLFQRYRVGLDVKYKKDLEMKVVGQLAEVDSQVSNQSYDRLALHDLSEAYVKIKDRESSITVGRQKIKKGEERLIGSLEWSNTGRAWDGIRYNTEDGWDAFVGRLAVNNQMANHEAYVGLVAKTHKAGETMLIAKIDRDPTPTTDVYTLNHRYVGNHGSILWTAEGSYQTGKVNDKDLNAFAATLRGQYKAKAKLSPYFEFNVASGGNSPTTTNTFDNLYPTNHYYYGLLDLNGLKNTVQYSIGLDWKACKSTKVHFSATHFELFDASDAWYNASGVANTGAGGVTYYDPTGQIGKTLGNEFDVYATTSFSKHLHLEYGGGYFVPGSFVKASAFNGGANNTRQIWGYVQATIKF